MRWGRILGTLVFLGIGAAGAYGASMWNARRYFLIVDATEVRVAKGRMLPVGHEPFVPADPALKRAYRSFPLPGGIKLPRGETTFEERIDLDQALFRVLKDALAFSLSADNRRSQELIAAYLEQLRAIPGTSLAQQLELGALEREAAYHDAEQQLSEGIARLKEAARLFHESAKGQGTRARDGELRARVLDAELARLSTGDLAALARGLEPPLVPTTTVAASTTAAERAHAN